MQDVVQVCFDAGAPFEDFVFVAGYFEALLGFLEAHEGDVGEFYLVGGLVDGHFDGIVFGEEEV